MAKVKKVIYFTKEKLNLISEDNKKKYEKYLTSCTTRSRDTKDTTYKTYKNFMYHFMAYLAEFYENIDLYSDAFMDDAVYKMEGYMEFCQVTLFYYN